MIYPVIFFSLLVALAFLFVFSPIRTGKKDRRREEGQTRLEAEKQTLVQLLRDLEFDYRTGKLSPGDYQTAREETESRAIAVLESLESSREELTPASLEAEIAKIRDRIGRSKRRA